ncbi:hypothetical protein ACWIUO_13320, partial [Helicobacter sp. T3_23-1056]
KKPKSNKLAHAKNQPPKNQNLKTPQKPPKNQKKPKEYKNQKNQKPQKNLKNPKKSQNLTHKNLATLFLHAKNPKIHAYFSKRSFYAKHKPRKR